MEAVFVNAVVASVGSDFAEGLCLSDDRSSGTRFKTPMSMNALV